MGLQNNLCTYNLNFSFSSFFYVLNHASVECISSVFIISRFFILFQLHTQNKLFISSHPSSNHTCFTSYSTKKELPVSEKINGAIRKFIKATQAENTLHDCVF